MYVVDLLFWFDGLEGVVFGVVVGWFCVVGVGVWFGVLVFGGGLGVVDGFVLF